MDEKTLSTSAAQRFYDRIGSRYDWFEFYEGRAKERAHEALKLADGQRVLSVGVGTGKDLIQIIEAISSDGTAYGLDISRVMLHLTKNRTSAPVCQADARLLPFNRDSFDRLYAAYVLDLLPLVDIPDLVDGFFRVLKPEGRMVILGLTEGVDLPSRALVAAWKGIFETSPTLCGGCRPLELSDYVLKAGFKHVEREVIVQLGVPSEIIIATKT